MFGRGKQELAAMQAELQELRGQVTLWGDWGSKASMSTWAGQDVSKTTALQLLAVYGSVRMISDGISTMPVDVYRRKADGTSEEIATPRWIQEPVVGMPFTEWCSQVLTSLLLDGNSFIAVMRGERGEIVELLPLANETVTVIWQGTKKLYLVNAIEFKGELLHIKAMTLAGSLMGLSPVEYARQTIGLGLAALEYGSEWFNGPGNMPGVIEAPRPMQPEAMTATAKAWQKFRQQGGQGLPGILQDGMTFKPIGVTNEQAQFLQTRQWSAAEIAGQMFLLDPSDLGIPVSGTSLTYGNLVERDTRRVKVAYLPWMVRIENALSALLFQPRFMKFNPAALLRGDIKTQYEAFNIGTAGAAFITIDEAREKLDLPPMPESSMPAPVAAPAPQANSLTIKGEERDTYVVSPNFTINVPKADAPTVNVAPPTVNVAAPMVRVAAPNVTVESRPTTRTVERDADGRISRVVEEV